MVLRDRLLKKVRFAFHSVWLDARPWLEGVVDALDQYAGGHLGVVGLTFERNAQTSLELTTGVVSANVPPGLSSLLGEAMQQTVEQTQIDPVSILESDYAKPGCRLFSEHPWIQSEFRALAGLRDLGIEDVLSFHTSGLTGLGCWFGIPLPARGGVTPRNLAFFAKMARHALGSLEFRAQISQEAIASCHSLVARADAVCTAAGELCTPANETAIPAPRLQELRQSISILYDDRDPRAWIEGCSPRIWCGGREYRLLSVQAGKKDDLVAVFSARVQAPALSDLSPTESECLLYKSLGWGAEAIADEFNIADSTVRNHWRNARKKLGCNHLNEAVERFRALVAQAQARST